MSTTSGAIGATNAALYTDESPTSTPVTATSAARPHDGWRMCRSSAQNNSGIGHAAVIDRCPIWRKRNGVSAKRTAAMADAHG